MSIVRLIARLALLAGLAAWSQAAAAQEAYTLKVANYASAGGGLGQMLEGYAKEIEAASGGRLKFEIFHGASLGPAQRHFDLIRSGVADAGIFSAFYTPGRFPKADLVALPNIIRNAPSTAAATELLMDLAPEHLYPEFEGVRMMWVAPLTQDQIFTSNRPVRTLDDVKGLRLRVTAKSVQEVLLALGAAPVSLPAGEIGDSLQKNAIDGVHLSAGVIWALRLGDLVDYQTPLLSVRLTTGFAVNPDAYARLPEDLQDLLDGFGGTERAVAYVRSYEEDNPVVEEYFAGLDIKVVEPDQELVDAVAAAADAYNEEILSELAPEMRQLYDRIRALDAAGG